MNEENLHVFLRRINRSLEQLNFFIGMFFSCRSDERFESFDWNKNILSELKESVYLVKKYNELKIDKLSKVRDCFVIDDLETLEEVMLNLRNVRRELQEARDNLTEFLKPNLSEKEKSKIEFLRKELDRLKDKNCDNLILQNLEEALNEAEQSHSLACGLISGRIIDKIIQIIKEGENLPKENIINNLIEKLRELKVLEKDEIAGQDKKEFLDAAKSSRDAVSHKIEFMPNGPKALLLLSYAFVISDILIKYNEKKNEN